MDDARRAAQASGARASAEDLARLSPLLHEHTKMLGAFHFALPDSLTTGNRRPLRAPDERS